jgi:hypothetical protein
MTGSESLMLLMTAQMTGVEASCYEQLMTGSGEPRVLADS